MDAGTHSLKVIFGQDRRHLVPLFQRPYVWTEQVQWAPLWEDIRSIAERALHGQHMRPHFLGAIVLDQVDVPYGAIDTRLVIDGQQRLTTIQIILEAFGDCCKARGLEAHERAAKRLTRNDDPLSTDEDHVFKIWPTNADQSHFRRVMNAGTPQHVLDDYGLSASARWVGHAIADAYLYFFRKIDEWFSESAAQLKERADAFLGTLRDSIRLVVIDLKDGDDPQLIFETLNARGTPLLPSDLIKNLLFVRASEAGLDRESLYKKYWREFDDEAKYWREEVGRGVQKRARLDIFMQNYLTLKTRDDVPVAHLYSVYKAYSSKRAPEATEEEFKSLRHYADIYRSFETFGRGTPEGRFFHRLRAMEATTAYPFLLELFSRLGKGSSALHASLRHLESFLVRRLVSGLTTKAYNRFFGDLLHVFDGPLEEVPSRLERALAKGDSETNVWPSDADVKQALLGMPIYRTVARARVNMILEALNAALHDGKVEQLVLEDLTIEHLMPQSWESNWPLPANEVPQLAAARRQSLIHSLGNLTLLTKKLNPAVSNGSWATKRAEILKYSALNLNRQLPEEWDEAKIEARTAALASLACEVWSAPADVRTAPTRTIAASKADPSAAGDEAETTLKPVEGTEKAPSPRQQIFYRFWTSLLDRAKQKTSLLANRSPTTDQWISTSSGRAGFGLHLSLTQEFARIECYIRLKNAQDVHNKAVLKALMQDRDAIEERFGEPLDWQELPGRIGCRICKLIPGSWQLPESQWPPLQDGMIDRLIRLEAALRQPIQDLDVDAILREELLPIDG